MDNLSENYTIIFFIYLLHNFVLLNIHIIIQTKYKLLIIVNYISGTLQSTIPI